MPDPNEPLGLSKERIIEALSHLNEHLKEAGSIGELCLFDGSAMVLVFNARLSTRDVDAIFQPAGLVRDLAARVAEELSLPEHWLNDGVKGFQSANPKITLDSVPQFSNLRVYRPSAEYLLAMKCMASRAAESGMVGDRGDIIILVKYLGLKASDEVIAIVMKFFPPERVPTKTQFMIHEVMADLNSRT